MSDGSAPVQVYAVDKSHVALAWAKLNVERLNLTDSVQVRKGTLLTSAALDLLSSVHVAQQLAYAQLLKQRHVVSNIEQLSLEQRRPS